MNLIEIAKKAADKAVVDNARGAAEAVAKGACAAFKERDYSEAVMKWGEALGCLRAARAPDSDPEVRDCRVNWHNNRAAALLQMGQHPEAEAAATEVLSLDATNLKALFRRGTARSVQFKWLGAVRDFERVLEGSPKNTKAAAQLAQAKQQLDKERGAEEEADAEKAAAEVAKLRVAKEEKRAAAEAKIAEAAAAAAEAAEAGGQEGGGQEAARKAAEDAYWAEKVNQMADDTVDQKKNAAAKAKKGGVRKNKAGGKAQPEHELTKTSDGFKLVISLPGVKSMKGVDIDISEDEVVLEAPEHKLRLYLPQSVDVEAVGAKFSKKTASLTLRLTRLVGTCGIDGKNEIAVAEGAASQHQDSFDRAAYAPPDAKHDGETERMMQEMAGVLGDMGPMAGVGGGAKTKQGGMDMGGGMAEMIRETMAQQKKMGGEGGGVPDEGDMMEMMKGMAGIGGAGGKEGGGMPDPGDMMEMMKSMEKGGEMPDMADMMKMAAAH